MSGRWLWGCLLLLLAAGLTASAQPSPAPLVLEAGAASIPLEGRAIFRVAGSHLRTPAELQAELGAEGWRVRRAGMQHRLDGQVLWIRFAAQVRDAEPWYLVVGSSGIDRVQQFHRGADGRWVVQEAGDSVPVSQWPVPGRLPTFRLAPAAAGLVDYWVRIEHSRVDFAATLEASSTPALLHDRDIEQLLLGGYFGIAVLLAAVSAANAIGWRDRNFAAYAVYLVLFSLGQAAYLGLGAQYLWDQWLEWNAVSTFLLPGLAAVAGLSFVHVVTEPARFSRLLDRLVWIVGLLVLLAVLIDTAWPSRTIFLLRIAFTTAAVALVALLIGWVWRKGDDPDIRLIALGFVPVVVMALFPIARGFGLIPNSVLTRYGLTIGAALEMPILFYALSRRSGRRREAQLRASALPHTDALTGLADRRSLLQRMEASVERARGQKHACALLVTRLANHEAIASDHGRETLDRALVVAASHMRRCASDIDLAARVGDRDFALFIEGPTNPDLATARAQQLVASGLRPAEALPPDLMLRLQVVILMLPSQHPDAAAALQWALGALASVRPDSRKQIRML